MLKKVLLSIGILALCGTASAQTVTVNGKDTGVSSEDAREAFERLGEAMVEAAEKADPGDRIIEVEAPDTRDIDPEPREPEPRDPEPEPDDFDFDEPDN